MKQGNDTSIPETIESPLRTHEASRYPETRRESDEEQDLVNIALEDNIEPERDSDGWKKIFNVLSIGGSCFVMALHYVGNGYILSVYGGKSEQAAVSLITSIQAVASGVVYGALTNTGNEIGKLKKDEQNSGVYYKTIGTIVKLSWISGAAMGLTSIAGLGAWYVFIPHIVSTDTATIVRDFMAIYMLGGPILEPFVAHNGLVFSRLDNDWKFPLFSMAFFRLSGLGLSYYLVSQKNMGATGLGLGVIIAGGITNLLIYLFLLQKKYSKYGFYTREFLEPVERLKSFLSGAWKLSMQRLSEWGNLLALSHTIGAIDNDALRLMTPFNQMNVFVGFTLQGMGSAAMVFIMPDVTKKRGELEHLESNPTVEGLARMLRYHHDNKKSFHKYNFMSVILAGLSCLIIYFTCEKSIQFFLGNSLTPDEDDIAKKIMYYGILGFLPDSLRIMSGGLLRGWNDLVTPTLASIISMTVIAIPIGAIIGLKCDKQDSAYPLFWLRIAGIALSALFNYYRFFCQHMKNEMADLHRMQSSVLSSPGQDELRASDIDANTTPHRKERDSAEIKVSNNANLFFSHSPRQHQLPVGNANTNSIQ